MAADLDISAPGGRATLAAYSGSMYWYVARLASEGDFTFADLGGSGLNQRGTFLNTSTRLTIGGQAYNVWRSEQLLVNPDGITLAVR